MAHRTTLLGATLVLAALIGGSWYLLRQPTTPEGPAYSEARYNARTSAL